MSHSGTELPIPNVRFHGKSWRVSGRATEIEESTFVAHIGHPVILGLSSMQRARSGLMLAALITPAQFSSSLWTNFRRYSVDRRSGATST